MQPDVLTIGPADPWEICVMTRGETVFANLAGALRGFATMTPGILWDAGKLLDEIVLACGDQPEILLMVPSLPGGGEDLPEDVSAATRWAAMEASALRAGWTVTGDAERIRDTGWVTFRRLDSGRKIFMGVLNLMDQSRTPLFDLEADAETITRAVITYGSVTGVTWRMTAGVSGCASIRADREERAHTQLTLDQINEDPEQGQPHWRWDKMPRELHGAGHMVWSRPLAPVERSGKIVTYDVRAQFVAALAGFRYGWGEPRQQKHVPFDPERAGFWLISSTGPLSLDGPPIIRHDDGGLTRVTTPVMVYLQERGIEPLVYESWTSATSSQILRPWAQRLRNAIYAESSTLRAVETALKRTYSETHGMFNVPGGSIYRGDWHWTTVDGSTMNVRRKLDRVKQIIGRWPCEIYHDAVSYPVADREEFEALNTALGVKHPVPQGEHINIGRFKYVRAETVEAWESKQATKKERTK